jgi:hypothetical protein
LASILRFARELDVCARYSAVAIDFGEPKFFSPFSMLFIASKFKSFRAKNITLGIEPRNYRDHTYPAHMGYFATCGFEFGREVGEAVGNENYLPITRLQRSSFFKLSRTLTKSSPTYTKSLKA